MRRAARPSRSWPRPARRASRWSCGCARRPRPSGSAASRRRARRSRPRRPARSSRSAPRSPSSPSRPRRGSSAARSIRTETASSSARRSAHSTSRVSRSRLSLAVAHRIYADALFGAAKDAGRLAQVHEAFADFAVALEASPELRSVLRNPQLDPTAKAEILGEIVGEEEQLFKNFLLVVAEKGRAGEIDEIAREFERLIAREERRLT